MDTIAHLGRDIASTAGPTFQVYGDLLREPIKASAIHATKRETFAYGPHDRQKLDLYTPSAIAPKSMAGRPRPVLIFAYGGGFVMGDRIEGMIPGEIVHTNLGYFFAEKLGFITIVTDYRLLSHGAKYHTGGEDIGGVVDWVEKNYTIGTLSQNDTTEIILVGNSAGAVHVATWLFGDRFQERRKVFVTGTNGVRLQGVVFVGCPFRWDVDGGMKPMLMSYYGGEQETRKAEPSQLMEKATDGATKEEMARWPPLLVVVSEFDPETDMIVSGEKFAKAWGEREAEKGNSSS